MWDGGQDKTRQNLSWDEAKITENLEVQMVEEKG